MHQILYRTWGSFGSWYRPQPLGQIRDYFGDQVAMYFAWLGKYTHHYNKLTIIHFNYDYTGFYSTALIFPAIAGFLCFLYGAVTIDSKDNVVRYINQNLQTQFIITATQFSISLLRISREICRKSSAGNLIMCPLCSNACPYWYSYSKIIEMCKIIVT